MRRLKNVTITLPEHVARWARIEAAKQDTSVSRYLGNVLEQQMALTTRYRQARKRALNRKPFLRTDGSYLSREQAHERRHLR
ncbi:MAG TPA: hypothetical protein VEJ47_07295 [Candidatus Eremiobacteraceae bacterium]|nr:hypothetical protein [Candidatus Eremiobacteraceae bacterium]